MSVSPTFRDTMSSGDTPSEALAHTDPVASLDKIDWSFEHSVDRDLTHDLHPWPAKFIPDIPANAIKLLSRPGDVVLDPFCGCGTTAVEALRLHRSVIALDVNPLAALITEAKCTVLPEETLESISLWVDDLSPVRAGTNPGWVPPIPNIDYWFDEPVIAQLSALVDGITAFREAQPFLKTVLSSVILGVSHQESETRYRRVERAVTAADVVARFRKRVRTGLSMLRDFRLAVDESPAAVSVACADARSFSKNSDPATADLAVFSPPYPNAFDYHLYHRFRMFWLGMDPRLVKHDEIGAHLKYQHGDIWREDMTAAFHQISAAIRPGGYVVCVVGDGVINGILFRSADVLWQIAESCQLTPLWRTERTVSRSRRAFNLSDSRLREEHVLVFGR